MSKTFNCPKCGAPQTYQGGAAATIQCPYCETTLIVPAELRDGASGGSGGTIDADVLAQIKSLLARNQKIQAIKVYRERYGVGLKQAKDAVEAIERGETVSDPRVITVTTQDSGQISIHGVPSSAVVVKTNSKSGGCVTGIVVMVIVIVVASFVLPFALMSVDVFNAFVPLLPTPTRAVARATMAPTRAPTVVPSPTIPPTPQFASAAQTIGEKGNGPGQLDDARRIAVDNKGNLYVGEYSGARVQRFDAKGEFQDQWNAGTSKQVLLGLAADVRGNVYAAVNGGIKKFDGASGKALAQLRYDVPGEGFDAIAVTPDGGVVGMWYERRSGLITSLDGFRERLVRFDREGNVTQVIENIINAQTDNLALDNEMAVDATGNLFILTGEREGTIFKFSPEGKLITRFGSRGNDQGQLDSPSAIAVDGRGRIYVAVSDGIMVFTGDGRYLDLFGDQTRNVRSMAFDSQNRLWVLSNDKITQYTLNAK